MIQADATTINQLTLTSTPLLQDDAPSFNQVKVSNLPDPCSFKHVESMMQNSDTNKYSKRAQCPQAQTTSSPLLGLDACSCHLHVAPEAPTQLSEHDGQPGCSLQL